MEVPVGGFRALAWFFEASNDAYLALQDGCLIARTNPAWLALAGQAAGSPMTDAGTFWDFIAPDDLQRVQDLTGTLAIGQRASAELRVLRGDGTHVWTRSDFVGGDAGWVLAILRDITMERRLRDSEVRFRGLVNATADVVYRMSPDWREMRALDGRGFIADTESPSVQWIDEYLLPEDQPHILAAIEDAVARQDVFQLEHRVRLVDGSVGWTFSRALPIRDETGEIIEWFGAASDVTERHRAEEHLKLVVHELNHRVKNNLAMMQAATWQSFRNARDLADADQSLTSRINALAHAADLLSGDAQVGPSVRGVVEQAVALHCIDGERCLIEGPQI
jgi:PAS domain-containing protein